ncbi:MAG: TRAP transporter small permease [bacterium]|nr:TRAP transporter small permease [bacterium]
MKFMRKVLKNIEVYIGALLLAVAFIDVMLQVLSRILPGNAISWTVELGEILLGAIIWIGIGAGVVIDDHVNLDFVVKRFPERVKKYLGVLNNIFFIIYLLLLGGLTYDLMLTYVRFDSKTTMLRLGLYWVRFPIVVGCVLAIIRLLIKTYNVIRNKEKMFQDMSKDLGLEGTTDA